MTSTQAPQPCRKCGGTGYLPHLARVDAGRCWACDAGQGPTDTSYTRAIEAQARTMTDEDRAAAFAAECAALKAARRARRTERTAR